jgi:diguanylate cyclase (GGDEF)-like protein
MEPATNHTLWRRLGLHSYRGRYLWITVLVSLLLIGLTLVVQDMVRQRTTQSTHAATLHARVISAFTDAQQRLSRLREALLAFALDPSDTPPERIDALSRKLQLSLERVGEQLGPEEADLKRTLGLLLRDGQTLQLRIQRLLDTRLDTAAWVPASRTMNEQMVPAATAIIAHLQNIESLLADDPEHAALREQALMLRVHWQQVLGEMRLIVANRFGTFTTDITAAMGARANNLKTYLQAFRKDLMRLTQTAGQRDEVFVVDETNTIQSRLAQWANGYQRLLVLLNRDGWRQDLVILRQEIDPVMQRMNQRLGASRLQLQSDTQAMLLDLLHDGERLARGIGWLSLILIALFGLGYLGFQRWLLRPIEHISEQLQREGRGETAMIRHWAPVSETHELIKSFREMREQVKARERRLDYMASHDALTGLPNRVLFHRRLNDALRTELPRGHEVAVLFMDLDRFKNINDTHGHLVGDKLLAEVATRLRSVFRSDDLVARLSGDEFAVLLQGFGHATELTVLAQKVIDALAQPFEIEDLSFHCSASLGVSIAPQDGQTADQLIQHSDTAMYHAKQAGRAGFAQFEHAMLERSAHQLQLENELHAALDRRQFRLFVQPIVDCHDAEVRSHECLLRWQHPRRGLLAPAAFLPVLEEIGLMQSVTDWILDRLEALQATRHGSYSINLSAQQLSAPDFLSHLHARLRSGNLHPHNLIIEITEDTLSEDLDRVTLQLADLQAIGVGISLDDFGTGQSSLSHLRAFPFDTVKIDRSFVRDVSDDPQDAALVRAIIGMAHTLDMRVVAEGVETPAQHEFLRREGCDLLQGYLFGRPAPIEDARAATG